ncbi:MAG TPA: 2-oxoglutarate and iron-dependent oxygenase domain-containing protein [Stellaceae bacterium]|nr:2-oxoglutarate and iron-dependent oxygenase domain-containing protein [Stellaceae bacterium]
MIPVIDIAGVRRHEPDATKLAAAAIHEACVTSGFFYIKNHGVPDPVIDGAVAQARQFFHLPIEQKRKVAVNARHRGFNALGDALMYEASRPDQKEFFSIGLELPEDDPDVVAGEKLRGPNNWPADMPDFRMALSGYYDALGACGADLMRAVAVSLGRTEDFFADKYRKRLQRTQIIYYPSQPPDIEDDQFGVAPHTDFGCVTLLWQDQNGGLEVLERSTKSWLPAPPIPGTLVVNVGDLLGRWTNDRYASTPHRVVNRSGRERFSIATFYDPDYQALIDPRALGTPESECRYEPVPAGDHIIGRISRSFGYRKTLKEPV